MTKLALSMLRQKLEKMKSSLHLVGEKPQNKHTIFVGDR